MPLECSYMLWNNRGGTGKTMFTYHLANKYAVKHPDKTVLVIDMCPQADLSHAFLGLDENKMDYVSQIGTLKRDPMIVGDQKVAKTVSGYLDLATSTSLSMNTKNLTIDPRTFLFNISKFNPLLARNIYLLCGDASLELIGRSLEQKRNQHSSISQFGQYAWKYVTCCLKQFVRKIAERKGIKLAVFIDSNSSFSILTEIALAASDKLIIPITDDHLRRNSFEYMFALLYGFSQPSNVYFYYRHFSFYYKALEHDITLPKIHLILNRLTTINKNDSAWEFIFDLYKKHPQSFTQDNENKQQKQQQITLNDFKNKYVIDIYAHESTEKIIRQAVRSHSPLVLKHTINNNNNNNSSMNNATTTISKSPQNGIKNTSVNKTSLLATPRLVCKNRSHSPVINHQETISNNSTDNHKINNHNNSDISSHKLSTGYAMSSINNLSINEEKNVETDAILFDNLLDKIVCSLTY
jgi:cellulose biosynthesis protein BcsQ